MTIRLAGVATGVRNAAAAATATAISTGLTDTSMSAAAETAIGMTISAVATLLISCPNAIVSPTSPARSAYGPAPPTTSTSRSASCSAAPLAIIAVESGIIAGDQDHGRPGDAAVCLLGRQHAERHQRARRQQPGGGRRHRAGGQQRDHRHEHGDRPLGALTQRHGAAHE